MKPSKEPFEITYNGETVPVEYYMAGSKPVFMVGLPAGPLFITQTALLDGYHAWTSVPQGRQKEAEDIGHIIDRYLNAPPPPKPKQNTLF